MTEISFGEYEPDVATVGTNKTAYVKNVVPSVNGYAPVQSVVNFTQALSSQCRGFTLGVRLSDNSVHLFAGTDTKLWKLDPTTRVWADVSGSVYNVGAQQYWSYTQFGSQVIAVTNGNNPQVYTIGSSATFADLGGTPPQARRVAIVGDFVVLSSLSATPNRIQWSAINNAALWTPGTNQSDFQDFVDGGYVQGVSGGEYGIVFQDRAIRRMTYAGPPTIFDFQRISEDRGVLQPYSIAKAANNTFFLANDGFFSIDQAGTLTPIGSKRVNRTFLSDADLNDARYMVGASDPANKRIVWLYKSLQQSNPSILDKFIIYDWILDRWSYGENNSVFAAPAIPLSATLESLDAVGNLDALPFSLDTYVASTNAQLAIMQTDMKLGFQTGANMEAIVETPEGQLGSYALTRISEAAPIGDAMNAVISVSRRNRLIDAAAYTAETTLGIRGYAPQRAVGRFIKARVRVPASNTWSFMRGVEVTAQSAGNR